MRHFQDWISAYLEYASYSEAPRRIHFWAGIVAVASVLRRHVWIDERYYRWYPNCYVIIVGPPGVVNKSTTASIAMRLVRQVPGVRFGPDVVTWPALTKAFAEAREEFTLPDGTTVPQCALTFEAGELGNLLDPQDARSVDLYVRLWESREGAFQKITKMSGNDTIVNECINIVGCTTPAWIAGNFPEYVLGGGFASRCIFVYGDRKEKLIAYPHLNVPVGHEERAAQLIEDLTHISTLRGQFHLTPEAEEWGTWWYNTWHAHLQASPPDDRLANYNARKQTHLHKVAMVLSAAQRDDLTITVADLQCADDMLASIEPDMHRVFSQIGRTQASIWAERFIHYVCNFGPMPLEIAYAHVHSFFTSRHAFDDMMQGCLKAGKIATLATPDGVWLCRPPTVTPSEGASGAKPQEEEGQAPSRLAS